MANKLCKTNEGSCAANNGIEAKQKHTVKNTASWDKL